MKGQELPLNVIVIIALLFIAIIVVLGFVFKFFPLAYQGEKVTSITYDDLAIIREACRSTYCSEIQGTFDPNHPEKARFCSKVWDTSSLGGIENDHCYDDDGNDIIIESCYVTDINGDSYYLTKSICGG